jgi:ABC-type transport system involved in multi-copper enzyme maturation permease subunit
MTTWLSGVGVVLGLELRQRVRGKAWYILLGIFTLLVALVTLLLWLSLGTLGGDTAGGIFSTLIFFVLLLGTLVSPAVSGNAINGDRAAGTLATTQVTLITTWQLVLGKFLAAWISALAFLAAAVPFLVLSIFLGDIGADTIAVSVLVLAIELGVLSAVGVGLSGLLTRPLFSIVVTYLIVAALSVGTLIAFGLLGLTAQSTVTSTYVPGRFDPSTGVIEEDENGDPICGAPEVSEYQIPRFDHFWGALVANPYVVLADAAPTRYDQFGNPRDLFGFVKVGARSAQLPPDLETRFDDCAGVPFTDEGFQTGRQIVESTTPGWFVGLTVQLLLGGGLLVGGWSATRTPTGRLPRDSRVA